MIDDFKPQDAKPFDAGAYSKRLGELNHADAVEEALRQAKCYHETNELCLQRGQYITHLEEQLTRTRASLKSQKRLSGMLISALAEISTDDPT